MANSVDPDQTAPIGAVCSGSMLFASILNLSVMLRNLFAADDFSKRHFQKETICSRRLQQATFSEAFFSWRFKG